MRIDNCRPSCSTRRCGSSCSAATSPTACRSAGYVDDVKKLSVDDLTAFYRRFYAPNNAVLIVAGDTTAEAGAQARRETLRADPEPQGRAAAPAGRGRRRPAAARDPRRCARRRAALVARFPRAVLPQAAKPGMPMRCRCWRGCWAAARPAACGALWWRMASSPCRRGAATAPRPRPHQFRDCRPAGARAQRRGGRDGSRRPDEEGLDGGVTAEEVERAQNQLLASAIYSQDSLASGPRLYGNALLHRRQHRPARQLAAGHRRGSAGRCRRRRAPRLARRGRGHVAAHAGRGLEMTVLRWLALALGFALGRRAVPKPSRSRKSPRRSGIKAWLVQDSSAPVVCAVLFLRQRQRQRSRGPEGADQPHGELADRRCGTARSQAFKQRQEDASVALSFGASLDRSAAPCALLSANRDEAFELLRLARRPTALRPRPHRAAPGPDDRRRSTRRTNAGIGRVNAP